MLTPVQPETIPGQKKVWHTPQCTNKVWRTPRVVSISFNQTQGGATSQPNESTGGS